MVSKGEIACNKQFLLFSQCFLSYMAFTFHFKCTLTLKLLIAIHRPFADSVDQDQTAQNVQSDLGSTLSDKEIFLSKKQSLK